MKLGPLQRKWVNSLKRHPERQLRQLLGQKELDGSYKACCLGEAGLIMGSCFFNNVGELIEKKSRSITTLENSFNNIGLFDNEGSVIQDEDTPYITLASLNDDKHHTWADIAYLIEAAPELFFTKSV